MLEVVEFLANIFGKVANFYNQQQYIIYRIVYKEELPYDQFLRSGPNALFWFFTVIAVVVSFSLLFIEMKNASVQMRTERKQLKLFAPIGMVFAPFTVVLMFTIVTWFVIRRMFKFGRQIKHEISNEVEYRKRNK